MPKNNRYEYQVKWVRGGGQARRKLYTQRPAAEAFMKKLLTYDNDYANITNLSLERREVSAWESVC